MWFPTKARHNQLAFYHQNTSFTGSTNRDFSMGKIHYFPIESPILSSIQQALFSQQQRDFRHLLSTLPRPYNRQSKHAENFLKTHLFLGAISHPFPSKSTKHNIKTTMKNMWKKAVFPIFQKCKSSKNPLFKGFFKLFKSPCPVKDLNYFLQIHPICTPHELPQVP